VSGLKPESHDLFLLMLTMCPDQTASSPTISALLVLFFFFFLFFPPTLIHRQAVTTSLSLKLIPCTFTLRTSNGLRSIPEESEGSCCYPERAGISANLQVIRDDDFWLPAPW